MVGQAPLNHLHARAAKLNRGGIRLENQLLPASLLVIMRGPLNFLRCVYYASVTFQLYQIARAVLIVRTLHSIRLPSEA